MNDQLTGQVELGCVAIDRTAAFDTLSMNYLRKSGVAIWRRICSPFKIQASQKGSWAES